LFFLLALGLCLQFLTLPMIKESKATKLKLEERKAYLIERKKIIERIDALQEEYKLWGDRIKTLDAAIPNKGGLINILFQLQNFASDSGLVMKNFGYTDAGNTISVSVNMVGSYTSLKAFLKKIERNLRIADVQQIAFSAAAAEKQEGEKAAESFFSASLSIEFYYFPKQAVGATQ